MSNPVFEISPTLLQLITEATELRTKIHQSLINAPWLPGLQQELPSG